MYSRRAFVGEKEKSTDEQTFEQYRQALKQEATRLACFIRVFRLLQERRGDRLEEIVRTLADTIRYSETFNVPLVRSIHCRPRRVFGMAPR